MEEFRELVIRGTEPQLNELAARIEAHAPEEWQRNVEAEQRASGLAFGKPSYCFVYAATDSTSTAALWLAYRGAEQLYVSNIVPKAKSELSRREYNEILGYFYERALAPVARQVGVDVELTDADVSLATWLSERSVALLESFSALANRSTGTSHPLDHRRWLAFVIQTHVDDSPLDASTLGRWLREEEGWSDDRSIDLSIAYEEARALLGAYDAHVRDG
jgi:hypothetical protein